MLSLILNPGHLSNLSYLICTRFSNLLLTILRQLIVERENLLLEEFERHDFADVYQVPCDSNTHLHLFIHTQTFDLGNNEALAQRLTHVLCKFVQDFESGHLVHEIGVVGQPQSEFHNMLLVIILNNSSNIEKNINGFVLHLLILVIKQIIKHSENLVGRLILLDLRALFLHKLDQGNKLVQQCDFNLANFACQNVQ